MSPQLQLPIDVDLVRGVCVLDAIAQRMTALTACCAGYSIFNPALALSHLHRGANVFLMCLTSRVFYGTTMVMSTSCIPTVLQSYPVMAWSLLDIEKAESLGQVLRQKRDDLKGTSKSFEQADVALALDLSQAYVSKIERGLADKRIPLWPSRQQQRLLEVYQFTVEEQKAVVGKFNLDVPSSEVPLIVSRGQAAQAVGGGPQAWHYGFISAGKDGRGKPTKPRLVSIPQWLADRYNTEDLFVLTVVGDSMTCDDIRKSIPEGSEVYFHSSLRPEEGEIVAVWLEDRDFGVIKIHKPNRDTSVLQSYNFRHEPILIDERNPAKIQGVYVGKSEPSPMRFVR